MGTNILTKRVKTNDAPEKLDYLQVGKNETVYITPSNGFNFLLSYERHEFNFPVGKQKFTNFPCIGVAGDTCPGCQMEAKTDNQKKFLTRAKGVLPVFQLDGKFEKGKKPVFTVIGEKMYIMPITVYNAVDTIYKKLQEENDDFDIFKGLVFSVRRDDSKPRTEYVVELIWTGGITSKELLIIKDLPESVFKSEADLYQYLGPITRSGILTSMNRFVDGLLALGIKFEELFLNDEERQLFAQKSDDKDMPF